MSDPTVPPSPSPEPASGPGVAPQTAADAAAAAPASSSTGLAPNVAAGLACVFSLIGGIVFLIVEKKNQFVRFWAMQALILGGAELALSIALNIATMILGHVPLVGVVVVFLFGLVGMVVGLAFLVLWIVSIIKAFTGKEWEIPYIGKIAREQLAKMAATTPPVP